MRTPLPMILITLVSALVAAPPARSQEPTEEAVQEPPPEHEEVTQLLATGWTFLTAGSLAKAEDAFTKGLELRAGKERAEVYYALSAVWWERRNAMASYSWLREAEEAKRNSWYWDGGEADTWDRRISGRLRYIERNFTAIKLRSPNKGKPLPPLADPPPSDPLLRSFTDGLAGQVEEGFAAGAGVQWFFLPNGTYWAADGEQVLQGGELEPTRAESWQLPVDRGGVRKRYDARVQEIEGREAETAAQVEARREARQRAWQKQQRPTTEDGEPSTPAPSEPVAGTQAVAEEPVVARPMEVDPEQQPMARRLITYDTAREVSSDLTSRWRAAGFHARYAVTCPGDDSAHEIDFPDQNFYVRFGGGGELKVRGSERLTEKLRSDWLSGDVWEANLVELWYDGQKLLVVVNGVEFGPVTVKRGGQANEPVGRWDITLSDPRSEIQHFWIERWQGRE